MVNIKENIWIILIAAGILGIISLFTPTIFVSSDGASIWVWNLYVTSSYIGFVQTEEALYALGITATIFIAIGTLITLFLGIISKVKGKRVNLFEIIGGVLLLIGPLIYLGGISVEEGIWNYFSVNIGSILPFFAGGIAAIVGVMGIIKRKS